MPETPDFDQIALRLVTQNTALAQVAIVEQFRLIWNARGTADEDAVFAEFRGPTLECLRAAGAIRMVDR